ncbi:hypothetical protein [Paraclostridium sordellii]|uniref:hypothetical protein n=1 Tax=Paraclostridium sordellii TaxID=1505 RepID=UPI0005E75E40|nr:hypothetical protein [Paeniclostridium sordellii]CEN21232.1 Uncharacterised protein [[Clostridium] sordellii] [Paeniclostridium sordellii]
MGKSFEPIDTTTNSTVANVSIEDSTISDAKTTLTYPIKQPDEYVNDFMVSLRASEIRKVRKYCDDAKKSKFPLHELLLAISTTCIGCFLGAVASNVDLASLKGIIMYFVSSIVASSTFVAYLFVRKNAIDDINELADKVKEYIVDPENM